jgi:sodium-coupled monocarboxylate transporter 8/12
MDNNIHWADYTIFAITLLIPLIIGIYYSKAKGGQNTIMKYLMGNKTMKVIPVAISLGMTNIAGPMVIGQTAEVYLYGTQLFTAHFFTHIMLAFSGYLFLPMIYKMKITSIFEYHKRRYNSMILHKICVFFYLLNAVVYAGILLYAPAVALEAVTGLPVWATVLSAGGVTLLYTSIGGILGVVWTDVFQGFIFFGGLIVILIAGSIKVGGLGKVFEISQNGSRIEFFNMDPDPTTRVSFLSTFLFSLNALPLAGTQQSSVQRTNAMPSLKRAFVVLLLMLPVLVLIYVIVYLTGLVIYAYYQQIECDPFRSRSIRSINQILPYFIVNDMKITGLTGLLMAVLFSGSLSTISSASNAISAIVWKDILEPYAHKLDEIRKTFILKMISFVFGLIAIGLALAFQYFQGNISQLTTILLSQLSSPTTSVFLAGSLLPWVTAKGVIIGMIIGFAFSSWIVIGQFFSYPHIAYLPTTISNCSLVGNATTIPLIFHDKNDVFSLYRISFQYFGLIGIVTSFIVAAIASCLTGRQDPKSIDPDTIVNMREKLCNCINQHHGEIDLNTDLKSNIQCIEKDPKNVQDIFNTKM